MGRGPLRGRRARGGDDDPGAPARPGRPARHARGRADREPRRRDRRALRREEPGRRDLDRRSADRAQAREGGADGGADSGGRGARRRTCARLPRARPAPVAAPAAVVVRGATVWTQGPAGILEDADVLVVDGRVAAVGKGLAAPGGRRRDRRPRQARHARHHRRPLAHRHRRRRQRGHRTTSRPRSGSATSSIPSMPRSTASSPAARRRPTCSTARPTRSAARTQIVKWRWGGGPDGLLVRRARRRASSSRSARTRSSRTGAIPRRAIPATRMGVAESIRERFQAAQDYRQRQDEFRKAATVKGAQPIPPAAGPPARGDRRDPGGHAHDPLPLVPQGRDPPDAPLGRRVRRARSARSSTCSRATRWPTRSRGTAPAPRASRDWWAYKFEVYRRDPLRVPADARARRRRVLQLGLRRARAAARTSRPPRRSSTATCRPPTRSRS